jgi:hypothetical protein
MKTFLLKLRAAAVAVAMTAAALLPSGAFAQIVTQLPLPIVANSITDFGNGPLELRVTLGNAWLFTSQGSGIGSTSGSNVTLTLTATPATPPCVGCIISGAGITPGTTVAAFNGTTTITMSAAMTVAAATPVAWGAACPAFAGGLPTPNVPLQPGGFDIPVFTQARICGYSANGPGAQILTFPIGAH